MIGATTDNYVYLWNKYRPAILKLMVDASNEPQEYQLSNHEVLDSYPRAHGSNSFTLKVFQNKAVNNVKSSKIAKDLLIVLKQSGKASELSQLATYHFSMDKSFVLHVKKEEEVKAETEESEVEVSETEKE